MLDLRRVVTEVEETKTFLKNRQAKDLSAIDEIVKLDSERKTIIQKVEELKHERNQASSEIAVKKRAGEDASEILEKMKAVAGEVKKLDSDLSSCDAKIQDILSHIPNRLHSSVPVGSSEADNREERKWGTLPEFDFEPLSHYEIGEKMGILNFLKAGEVTGARFVFLKGIAARLERALIDFMINVHSNHGYEEIQPPFIVNRDALFGTGQLPKFEEDVFKIEGHEFYLTPTAEVPVTNFHRNEILNESQLPIRYVAYSPCFRSEAGSYGKDTKGLKRQHQFEKVELVKFSQPEKSYEELDKMCADAERILQLLNLPYRVISLCSGDIGFSAAKTYDIEVWSPFSNSYVEISSCSNCEDFQARRAHIRYRNADKKVQHVHTLNGSGLAVGRAMLAIMENYQTKEGIFTIPDALKPYLD